MDKKIESFLKLANIFNNYGFRLYLVGGTVRDYLLNKELTDFDIVSDATPTDIKSFYEGKAIYTFERFGAVTIYFEDIKFELTTLREETNYIDSRHPSKINFVKSMEIDYKRRDFTINGMYLDEKMELHDFVNGQNDLNLKIIRMIGDSETRIKEDPLRILRAIRFAITFDFKIDDQLFYVLKTNINLLDKLNIDKIRQEIRKIPTSNKERIISLFNEIGINNYLDMVKY